RKKERRGPPGSQPESKNASKKDGRTSSADLPHRLSARDRPTIRLPSVISPGGLPSPGHSTFLGSRPGATIHATGGARPFHFDRDSNAPHERASCDWSRPPTPRRDTNRATP